MVRDAPLVLGGLVRRYGSLPDCEDAVQEALVDAAAQWPRTGIPDDPRAWLTTVARRRLIDGFRSSSARRARERREQPDPPSGIDPFDGARIDRDDSLDCLLMCCHPALTASSQVALTLRAVSGLTTAQIAAGFLVPERTMGQRISRAKATLRDAGVDFGDVVPVTPARLSAARHVLSLLYNEGYARSDGGGLVDTSLAAEAIRLARQLRAAVPDDTETAGLLALMLLTHARVSTRTDESGDLVTLADQDRSRWDRAATAEGVALIERALVDGPVGPFQLQAAIAAVHAEAAAWDETDWPQILVLYRMLESVSPTPTVRLNLAVAVAMVDGPAPGLALTAALLDDPLLARHHRLHAVHGQLSAMAGDHASAERHVRIAASHTRSLPEQRHLLRLAAELASGRYRPP